MTKKEFNHPTLRILSVAQVDILTGSTVSDNVDLDGETIQHGDVIRAPGRANSIIAGVADQK